MEILRNEFFSLYNENSELYISVYHTGYEIREFSQLLLDMPTLELHNFMSLKRALAEASGDRVRIGSIKPRVEVSISFDEMEARIKLNITAKEFTENKITISTEIIQALEKAGITEGLDSLFSKPLTVQKEITIAKGIPPEDGEDAIIKYYELSEKKPLVKDDGTVNHYELDLIENIKKGDWLGDKTKPTEGKPGRTVTGKPIPARRGMDFKLKYDRKTVEELEEDDKTVLRAAVNGAVRLDGESIGVDNHLIIPGDVGFETGNISFDGYVTVKGTVKDGFSIIAKNDISIQSPMGLGVINRLVSQEGSIYIKGGISGKNVSVIQAKKSVFVKYCNATEIVAGEDINIGFYSLDSSLKAKKVVMDPVHGKIIGGSVNAEIQVITGVIGNKSEKRTIINVAGFDRAAIRSEFEQLLEKYKSLLGEVNAVKQQIGTYERRPDSDYLDDREYNQCLRRYADILDEIKLLDEYRKRLQKILETKGEGQIDISLAAYP
ncbi:MAG: DUF342 domain-containing protein, partial [Pseudomonadota bacterium]